MENIKKRLEELRIEIKAERISLGEIAELQSLAKHIDPSDVELLEWAGVDENPVDLFEHHENLPTEVKEIINKYGEQSMNYHECKNLIHELEKVGYTCEYGLDAVPYNLTKLN